MSSTITMQCFMILAIIGAEKDTCFEHIWINIHLQNTQYRGNRDLGEEVSIDNKFVCCLQYKSGALSLTRRIRYYIFLHTR